MAAWAAVASTAATLMVPSSSMSILAPVTSQISRMTLPPVPITSRILSLGMLITVIRGALALTPSREESMALAISPRICSRPSWAWASAIFMISGVIEAIFRSICREVMPRSVPATLKSMSPR